METVGSETEAYAIADTMAYCKSDVYTVNCGMAYGQAAMLISLGAKGYRALQPTSSSLAEMFGTYGKVKGVYAANESGTHVIVSYHEDSSAQAALKELDGVHVLILEAVHFTFAILHNHLASGGNEPIQLSPSIGFSKKCHSKIIGSVNSWRFSCGI